MNPSLWKFTFDHKSEPAEEDSPTFSDWAWFSLWFGVILMVCWLATSLLMALLFPSALNRASDLLSHQTAKVFAVGIVFWFAFALALLVAVLLSWLLIGLPLLGGLLLLGVIVRWFGLAAVFLWIGRGICRRATGRESSGPWMPIFTGAALVAITHMIPVVGLLLWILFFIPVAGAAVLAVTERNRPVTGPISTQPSSGN